MAVCERTTLPFGPTNHPDARSEEKQPHKRTIFSLILTWVQVPPNPETPEVGGSSCVIKLIYKGSGSGGRALTQLTRWFSGQEKLHKSFQTSKNHMLYIQNQPGNSHTPTIHTLETSSQVQLYHTGNVSEEHLCQSLRQSQKLRPCSLPAFRRSVHVCVLSRSSGAA